MCVFMDLIQVGSALVYPSVKVMLNNDTEKVFSFVQYVFVSSDYITITRAEPVGDVHEHIIIENAKYFTVINKVV